MLRPAGLGDDAEPVADTRFPSPLIQPRNTQGVDFPTEPQGRTLVVASVAPTDKACGIAEHARRLGNRLKADFTLKGIPLFNLSRFQSNLGRRERRRACMDIVKLVRRSNSDLVHIHHEFSFFGAGRSESIRNLARVLRATRTPIVLTLHTWPTWDSPPDHLRRKPTASVRGNDRSASSSGWHKSGGQIRKKRQKRRKGAIFSRLRSILCTRRFLRVISKSTAVVVHSRDTYQRLITACPKMQEKTFVIPLPVDIEARSSNSPVLVKHPDEKWVVLPGFVSAYKGHEFAVAALKHLPSSYRLVIAGGVHPRDRGGIGHWNKLLAEIDALGLQSRVLITGFLEDAKQQYEILSQADCFYLPYKEVGQSGSAVLGDVLAYMKPVVTSEATVMFAYRSQVDTTYSSLAVNQKNPELVAQVIQQCVEQDHVDIELIKSHQRVICDRCSLEQTAKRYQKAYFFAMSRAAARFRCSWLGRRT